MVKTKEYSSPVAFIGKPAERAVPEHPDQAGAQHPARLMEEAADIAAAIASSTGARSGFGTGRQSVVGGG